MPYTDGTRILPGGFGETIIGRMKFRREELSLDNPVNSAYAIHPENLQQIYEDLLTENGVTILYMCKLAAVDVGRKMNFFCPNSCTCQKFVLPLQPK